jgi:formylglycine-generating enzyme
VGQALPAFVPLEVREIGVSTGINLVDTTAPVFAVTNGVVINGGANVSSSSTVSISLSVNEQGSGLYQMQVRLNDQPTEPNWETYLGQFDRDLRSFYNYLGNGTWRIAVRLKDRAGNISSWSEDSIDVSDQLTSVSGIISEPSALTWRKSNSPYVVTNHVRIPSGSTLIIEPGVEVRFAGAYNLVVDGTINVLGTESESIVFTRTAGNQSGAAIQLNGGSAVALSPDGTWVSGNLLQHAVVDTGIQLSTAVLADGYPLYAIASTIGSIGGAGRFQDCTIAGGAVSMSYLVACSVSGASLEGIIEDCDLVDVDSIAGSVRNSRIRDSGPRVTTKSYTATFANVEIRDIDAPISFGYGRNVSFINLRSVSGLSGTGLVFDTIHDGLLNIGSIRYSRFVNVGRVTTNQPYGATIDCRYNYWGPAWTQELDAKQGVGNLSFIYDGSDDIYLGSVDTTGYLDSPLEQAGYGGSNFVDVQILGGVVLEDGRAYIASRILSELPAARIRMAESYAELALATWQSWTGSDSILVGSATIADSFTVFVQFEDTAGNVSVPLTVTCPVFEMVAVQGGSSDSIPNGTQNGIWSVSSFSIGRYEVTQAQYSAVMDTNLAYFNDDLNWPVVNVTWYSAVEFCNRLSRIAGLSPVYSYSGYGTDPSEWPAGWNNSTHNYIVFNTSANGYRLPTEAEWEWAARGGIQSQGYIYAGSNTVEDVAWITTNSGNTAHPVGTKIPNELGLYDMSGNQWEWSWDWSGGSIIGVNPTGPASGSNRVLRGGSWFHGEYIARFAYRANNNNPNYGDSTYGFRIVRPEF